MKTTSKYLFWALIYALAITSPIWARALLAHAEPTDPNQAAISYAINNANMVCTRLDTNPTIDGIADVGLYIINHSNLTVQQAGTAIGLSIHYHCPRHQKLINQFVAKYRPQPAGGSVIA
jgi:hypothetical protein